MTRAGCAVFAGYPIGEPVTAAYRRVPRPVDDVTKKPRHGVAGVISQGAVEGQVGECAVAALPGGEGERSLALGHDARLQSGSLCIPRGSGCCVHRGGLGRIGQAEPGYHLRTGYSAIWRTDDGP